MSSTTGGAPAPSILVVDDNPDDLAVFARVARKQNWRTETAASGREGLQRAQANRYDLVVLDYNLGDMTGTEVLLRLKEAGLQTPILIQSGVDSHFILARSLALGADGFVPKDSPQYESELVGKVHAMLQRATTLVPTPAGRREGVAEVEKVIDDLLERGRGGFTAVGFASPDGFRVSARFKRRQSLPPETVCAMIASAASAGRFLGEGLGYKNSTLLTIEYEDGALFAAPIPRFGVLFAAVEEPAARAPKARMEVEFAARELATLLGTMSRAKEYTY